MFLAYNRGQSIMQQAFPAFFFSFVVLVGATQPAASPENGAILNLLQQSHDSGEQLPASARANLLPRQAQMAAELKPDLGRAWANELFTLSLQLKGNQQKYAQGNAMRLLVRLDPDKALELLHDLNDDAKIGSPNQSAPKVMLAQQVFSTLIAREGIRALPVLEEEAEVMGAQGHYPYSAMAYAAMQVTSRDWGSNKQHAIDVLRSVFEPAFASYSQGPHEYRDDVEFGSMLRVLAGGLPLDVIQPGLRLFVERVLAMDTRTYQFGAQVYSRDGQKAKADNAVDATILYFGELINRDPELAQQLESTRPELQTALQYSKDGGRPPMFITSPRYPLNRDPNAEMRGDAVMLSQINPEAAISKAEQLPDGAERTNAILGVARGVADSHPERAGELIAEVQSASAVNTEGTQLDALSVQAEIAAAQHKTELLRELLRQAFPLAVRIVSEQSISSLHLIQGLGRLVQIGMQNEPDSTTAFLQSLSPSYEKADLLLAAASALQMQKIRSNR